MSSKFRLAAVGEVSSLAPLARVARALERRSAPPATVVVTVEPWYTPGQPLAGVQKKLVEGEIDAALCPATRLPQGLPREIEVGAIVRSRDPRYWYVSLHEESLEDLPRDARVVTCDAVARAQLRHRFSSLRVELSPPSEVIAAGLRHEVWRAACVPAELVESDPSLASHGKPLRAEEVTPVVGQGLVAVLLRAEGGRLKDAVQLLNDPALEHCLRVERAFLARLAPLAERVATAWATRKGGMLELTGILADKDGRWLVADQAQAPARFGEVVALEIADSCRSLAAGEPPEPRSTGETTERTRP